MMTASRQIADKLNGFNQQEIEAASTILFHSFFYEEKLLSEQKILDEQISSLENFIYCLNRLLKSNLTTTASQRVTLLKTIGKLTDQKETLEIISGKVRLEDLQAAAERMGRKSQSAVVGQIA